MSEIKICKINDLKEKHKNEHPLYEYYQKDFIPRGFSENCKVSIYEIPPLKSNYPYHYHHMSEEVFFILSGEGILKTPDGDKEVSTGMLIYLPASSKGAHKLTNTSENSNLVYIDFDTMKDYDIVEYPDSNKIGVYGKDIYKILNNSDKKYYDGE